MTPPTNDFPNAIPLPFRNHTSLLLATALPFLQPSYRHPVELIIKFLELSDTMKAYRDCHTECNNPFSELFRELMHPQKENGLLGFISTIITDIEGLLCSLSKVCTGSEQEIVNLFLNIIRAKNFYDTYGDLFQMSSMFAGTEPDTSPPASDNPSFGDLSSLLNSDQQETLNLLKNLFSTD